MTVEVDPVAAAAEIKRSQSSLELLSNTAAWKNVVEKNQQQQQEQPVRSEASPPSRVSPAEQSLKTNSFASSGDFRKDIGMSFDEAATFHSPPFGVATDNPGLPLMDETKPPSSASLISSTSSNNLQGSLPTFTSTWHQQLNPSMHAAFTPPRSNLRASNHTHAATGHFGESFFPTVTRSLHDSHHGTANLPSSRQGSSDEGEWSFAAASMESSAHLPVESTNSSRNNSADWEALREENEVLKAKLREKDLAIRKLTQERDELQSRVDELRQVPMGKISQIPIEDMMDLMRTYGSEFSDTVMPPRKTKIQKASVIRQFRRWNPNFLEYFHYIHGKWVPKLGKEGELKRREEVRRQRRVSGGGTPPASVASSSVASGRKTNSRLAEPVEV
eukprot:scaffold4976_cov161-Amphora_coffeaeformis.AAC.5